jgi:cytochrome P450
VNPPLYCRGPGLNGLLKQLEDRAVDRDFPTFIQTANQSKTPLPPLYSLSEAVDLLLAGTDTLSITLVNILFHLTKAPGIVTRLQMEVDSLETTSLPSLEKLPLLTATIKEGLRLSHGVLGRLPRIAPSGGWTFEGVHVPAGTIISSSAPVVHNDPSIFPNPLVFVPDRWLREDGTYNVTMEQHLMSFSKGQRSCIGVKYFPDLFGVSNGSLAYAELYLTLSMFLREFDFMVVTGVEEMALIDVFATFFNTRKVELEVRRRQTVHM